MADTDTTSNWAVTLAMIGLLVGALVCAVIWPLPTMAVSLIALVLIVSSLDKKDETPVEITPEVAQAIALAAAMLREEEENEGESGGGQPH